MREGVEGNEAGDKCVVLLLSCCCCHVCVCVAMCSKMFVCICVWLFSSVCVTVEGYDAFGLLRVVSKHGPRSLKCVQISVWVFNSNPQALKKKTIGNELRNQEYLS